MNEHLEEIRTIENRYGTVLFNMGLTHMVDVGYSCFDASFVEESIGDVMAQGEEDKANGIIPVMSLELQCNIWRCATELTRFSIWTLFAYIKKHVVVGKFENEE